MPDPLGFPMAFDPITGFLPLPELAFDTCAGAHPGTPSGESCPEGYGATLFADRLAPAPFMFGKIGHQLTAAPGDFPATCPTDTPAAGAGQTPITVYSQTPLDGLRVEWRPYGTTREWQSLTVDPPTPADQRADWFARFESETFTRGAFYLVRCIVIDRDPNTAYEVRFNGIDAFLRVVPANRLILPDETPEGRPPTTGSFDRASPRAQITAWTKPEGSVTFTIHRITDLADASDRTCDTDAVPQSLVQTFDRQTALPVGVYDPAFTRKVVTEVPVAVGALLLVCATIYDTDNTLRPLGTDYLVLQGPTAQLPQITLEGIRLNDGVRIRFARLHALIQFPGERPGSRDGCAHAWVNNDELSGAVAVQAPLWVCDSSPLPVDSGGHVDVPVTIGREVDVTSTLRERRTQSWIIPIQLDTCDPDCPARPTEWYEIPIPTGSEALCGGSFWESSDGCPQPSDGVAIVKVEYPVIDGATNGYGTVAIVGSSDRSIVDPTDGAPVVQLSSTVVDGLVTDPGNISMVVSLISDRPITITSLHLTGRGTTHETCSDRDIPVDGSTATDFEFEVSICAGVSMSVLARYTDAAGIAYETNVGLAINPYGLSSSLVNTRVELLGGDAPPFGYFYRFELMLDGQRANLYGGLQWSSSSTFGGSCLALDDAVGESLDDPMIMVYDGALDVHMTLHILTHGSYGPDCPQDPAAIDLGPIELNGSFTMSQLASGEPLVLRTPASSPLQVRITVTGNWLVVSV